MLGINTREKILYLDQNFLRFHPKDCPLDYLGLLRDEFAMARIQILIRRSSDSKDFLPTYNTPRHTLHIVMLFLPTEQWLI